MSAHFLWQPGSTADTTTTALTSSLYFDVVTNEEPSFPNTIAEHVVEEGPDVADNIRVGLNTIELEVFITKEPMNAQGGAGPGSPGNPGGGSIGWATVSGAVGSLTSLNFQTPNGTQPILPQVQGIQVPEWFQLPIGVLILGAIATALVNPQNVPMVASIGSPPTLGINVGAKVLTFTGANFDPVQLTHDQLKYLRDTSQLIEVVGSKGTYDNMTIENLTMKRTEGEGSGATFTISLKQVRLVSSTTVAAPVPTKPGGNTQVQKGSQATNATPESAQAESWLSQLSTALVGSGNAQTSTLPAGVQTP